MPGTCFSSNLGARAVQCNPQDVSGTQRYRFFATALINQKEEALVVSQRRTRKRQQSSSSSSSLSHCHHNGGSRSRIQSQNNKKDSSSLSSFVSNGTQTDRVRRKDEEITLFSSPPSTLDSQQTHQSPEGKKLPQPLSLIEMEKIAREKERKEQEAALPPVTDKESLEAYRIFLEENEHKDFALREKELDEIMKAKLKRIKEDLQSRYRKENEMNQEKIEVRFWNHLGSTFSKTSSKYLRKKKCSHVFFTINLYLCS